MDDYRDVDPRLGTLADFDELVRALHANDIKVVVDVVPNHTSNRHEWFHEALHALPGSPARQRYIFRDGQDDGRRPPNDWQSLFGGSAWERVAEGQWYFHHFAKEQPDLNWHNEEVRADFLRTLAFWADRGVDGFRVDAAHGLVKDLSEPFVPWAEIADWFATGGEHPLWDRDEVHEVYASWRKLFNSYDPPLFGVAEAGVPDPTRRARYASREGLGQAFNFDMMDADWRAVEFRRVIDAGLNEMRKTGSASTWLLGCHDTPRVATRYGLPLEPGKTSYDVAKAWLLSDGTAPLLDRALGERRARAALLMLAALPGSLYVYQGDELGLHEVGDLPRSVLEDPIAVRSGGREKGRDGCRVPLPWAPEPPSLGFGPGAPHVPQPHWFAEYAVSRQERDPRSTLNLCRRAISLRAQLPRDDHLAWAASDSDGVLHFVRAGKWHCVTNFGPEPAALPAGEVILASEPLPEGQVPQDVTVWLLQRGS